MSPPAGTARNSLNQPNVWLTILLTIFLCVLPVVAIRFVYLLLWPSVTDKVGRTHTTHNTHPHAHTKEVTGQLDRKVLILKDHKESFQ